MLINIISVTLINMSVINWSFFLIFGNHLPKKIPVKYINNPVTIEKWKIQGKGHFINSLMNQVWDSCFSIQRITSETSECVSHHKSNTYKNVFICDSRWKTSEKQRYSKQNLHGGALLLKNVYRKH